MRIITLVILFYGCLSSTLAQNLHDNTWLIGYDTSDFTPYGGLIQLNFKQDPVQIDYITSLNSFGFDGTNTIMSDENGELLFFTNGCSVVNSEHEVMKNGTEINPGNLHILFCQSGGSPLYQSTISIPQPGNDSIYYVFGLDFEDIGFPLSWTALAPQHLYCQTINMNRDNGLGEVTDKNKIIIQDTFARSSMTAVQHSNQEDWWVVVPKFGTNCYYLILVTKDGIQTPKLECSGFEWDYQDKIYYSSFSPDGTKFARHGQPHGLNLYDFDSNLGIFSNPIHITFPDDEVSPTAGAAFSQNSRFLYVTLKYNVYQFDMWSNDIEASKTTVAVWDGTQNPYATIFNFAALAPDGKIYISSTSSHLSLHVIHSPDSAGMSCNFEQNGIDLPSYNFVTLPNFPYYRNGTTSVAQKPTQNVQYKISPNPSQGRIFLQNQSTTPPKNLYIEFYDILGKRCKSQAIQSSISEMDISDLKNGMYVWRIRRASSTHGGAVLQAGKVLKID